MKIEKIVRSNCSEWNEDISWYDENESENWQIKALNLIAKEVKETKIQVMGEWD